IRDGPELIPRGSARQVCASGQLHTRGVTTHAIERPCQLQPGYVAVFGVSDRPHLETAEARGLSVQQIKRHVPSGVRPGNRQLGDDGKPRKDTPSCGGQHFVITRRFVSTQRVVTTQRRSLTFENLEGAWREVRRLAK